MEAVASVNLLNRDLIHWNSIIKHHAKHKNDRAILTTYTQMEVHGVLPDNSTLPLVLKACGKLQAIERGKRIHNDIMKSSLVDDVRTQTALVDFYCKCGLLDDALHVFDEILDRDIVCWNAMISGYVGLSCYEEVIALFRAMQRENLKPNSVTVVTLLLACGELMELKLGKEIHGFCMRNGLFDCNTHVGTALIGLYSRFCVGMAREVFEMIVSRNVACWNAMICGYFDAGDCLGALDLFLLLMVNDENEFDVITMLMVIQACGEVTSLKLGMQVHQLVIKYKFIDDLFIVNSLLNMYSNNGSLALSIQLFESALSKDTALWNSMMSAYVEIGSAVKAVQLYIRMRLGGVWEDERTIPILLSACVELNIGLSIGKSIHAHVIKSGMENCTYITNAILLLYAEHNSVQDAFKVFDFFRNTDVISWNTLIHALARNGFKGQAWELFEQMRQSDIKPNGHSLISMLASCEDQSFLSIGKSIHGYVIKHDADIDAPLNTALIEMYMNCHNEPTAWYLFENYCNRDLISWNSFIACLVKNKQPHEALLLFHHMIDELEPNSVTIINVLSSCTHTANLQQGQCLHAYTIRRESSLDFDLSLANAFLTMYSTCGSIQYAENIFKMLPKRNVISWNAMIDSYGMHGRGYDAMLAFSKMLKDGVKPNGITFVTALSACSHSGLVEKGLSLFNSMVQDFCIIPELVHYGCIVDLLGRSGRLNEARDFINLMPITPDASIWRALLSACRVYSETKLAKSISGYLFQLEPTNAGNYVLLSNIYAASGLWSDVRKLRMQLEEKGLKKPAGKSWIVVRNKVHCFVAGDRSHPQLDKIYTKLRLLMSSIRQIGYVPDLRWVLHEEEDEDKTKRLFSHSEKLATTFGLISVSNGFPVLVNKNLRVCGDCHEFGKYVSKLVKREIILRDGSRFHHFVNGICSCKDYW